jgi:hypothetical protein
VLKIEVDKLGVDELVLGKVVEEIEELLSEVENVEVELVVDLNERAKTPTPTTTATTTTIMTMMEVEIDFCHLFMMVYS